MPVVKIKKIHEKAQIPQYMTEGASGCDVTACLETSLVLLPGGRLAIATGLQFEVPQGYEIQVRPRSGFALKKGLTVLNAPGTIDSDYRGELKVLVVNLGQEPVEIQSGDRIAQLVVQKVERVEFEQAHDLSESARSESGFGSTGFNG